eukprot:13969059-Ditylum_brightwellii.AAC.1
MKQSTAQCISDTVRFEHHSVHIPSITPVQRLEKATKELTNAVRNAPTDAPPDYLTAVQRLRAVLLKEKQPKREIPPQETIPQHNPNQIKPTPSPPTNNIPNN